MNGVAAIVAALVFGNQHKQDWGFTEVTPVKQATLVGSQEQI
jgi:hypothetical protein